VLERLTESHKSLAQRTKFLPNTLWHVVRNKMPIAVQDINLHCKVEVNLQAPKSCGGRNSGLVGEGIPLVY